VVVAQPNKPASPPTAAQPTKPQVPPAYRPLPEGLLAWDGETQETTIPFGTPNSKLAFNLTNISDAPLTVRAVRTSCGCTVPKMPPMPWTLEPGEHGNIGVTMKLAGKRGTVTKTVTLNTDQGFKTLYVRTKIDEPPPGAMGAQSRMQNLQIASADRQAVFKGDCVTCHVTPALNKMGAELYQTACGICHEAEHRASMVPDLARLNKETNADYWRTWITSSAEGKLMPAFALEHGGILNAMQIESLVDYLLNEFPENRKVAAVESAH
jgi:mono/diheme cytochrome c family protein